MSDVSSQYHDVEDEDESSSSPFHDHEQSNWAVNQVAIEGGSESKAEEVAITGVQLCPKAGNVDKDDASAFAPQPAACAFGGGSSGLHLSQGTPSSIPQHPYVPQHPYGAGHMQSLIDVSGALAAFPGTANVQFLPYGLGTSTFGQQAMVMPAYIVSSSQVQQPFFQNRSSQGRGNPPVQHIFISIAGAGVADTSTSSEAMMISSNPSSSAPPATFQTCIQVPSPGNAPVGTNLVLQNTFPSLSNQNLLGEYSLLGGSALGGLGFDAMITQGASKGRKLPKDGKKKPRKPKDLGIPPKVIDHPKSSTDRRFNSAPISLVASSRCEEMERLKLTGVGPLILYTDSDTESLSEYQCFLRKFIEIFEAGDDELQWYAQKMNKGLVLGQVGIRCRYCASRPPWVRSKGSTYYAATLDGLYQAGQNMSKNHLTQCPAIPDNLRHELCCKKEGKRRASGGKHYWAESARGLGVIEDRHGLRFSEKASGQES